jgi:hypothetical protein
MVVAQPVVDQLELFTRRGHRADVAVSAALSDPFSESADKAGLRQNFHRFDGRPPHQPGTLLGDVSAVHGGVGLVVSGSQPRPTRQLGSAAERGYRRGGIVGAPQVNTMPTTRVLTSIETR